MTVLVAVPDSPEGAAALAAAATEAETLDTDLVVMNLGLTAMDPAAVPSTVKVTVVERSGREDRDPVDAVLDHIEECGARRLVIGVKRRAPIGKAILGSISQRLILEAPIPVLAVKVDHEPE